MRVCYFSKCYKELYSAGSKSKDRYGTDYVRFRISEYRVPLVSFVRINAAQREEASLLIYDTNMKSEPLKLMYTIPLKGVTDFSTTSLMGEILKGYTFRFTSDGFTYSFKNCRRQAFLDVLQQEINK